MQISERHCDLRYDTPAHDDVPPYQVCSSEPSTFRKQECHAKKQNKLKKKGGGGGGQLSSNSKSQGSNT